MKAVRIQSYGGSEVLSFEETPLPVPGDNDALIHVKAASINQTDIAFRSGYMASYIPLAFPITLGLDIAGIVEAVGSAVTNLRVGDPVYARMDLSHLGGYAEYAVVNAAEVVRKPDSLDYIQAASIPHAALTAWRALIDIANLTAGQRVLIHAAAGGVGSFAVQLAKIRGAYVLGTASTSNQEFLRELGVDEPIDYTAGPFENKVKNVDVVFDTVGGDTLARSYQVLKPGGILVTVMEPPSAELAARYGVRAILAAAMPPVAPVLNEINALVEAGRLKPYISAVLPLSEARKGHDMVAPRHTRGKVVFQV